MILKGKNVILRPVKMSDAPRFFAWLKDVEIQKMNLRRPLTLKEEKQWIRMQQRTAIGKMFAIDTVEGVHIGSIGLDLNRQDKNAHFGIFIGDKQYWGKGYGTDASRTLLQYGFSKLRLHRVYLNVYEYNARAIALYTKLGFKKEGCKREHIYFKGKYYDDIAMGLLKEEWKG